MKRIFVFLFLSASVFAQTNLVRVPASTVGGSGAKCQLRGVTGTRTAAIDSINGVYNSPYFEFAVTTSGRYDLYYDSNGTTGGVSYSKQTDWSGDYGRWIDGVTDAERALDFQETADSDNDGKVETAGLEDSVVTSVKILSNQVKTLHLQNGIVTTAKLADDAVTAAKVADDAVTLPTLADDVLAYVATGGDFNADTLRQIVGDSVAALAADGVTIVNDGTFKQKVFNSTTDLSSVAADSNGMAVVVRQFGTTGVGGGVFQWFSTGYTANGITVFAGSSGYWVRLRDTDIINVEWGGVVADNTTDQAAKLETVINYAIDTGSPVYVPASADSYYVASAINIASDQVRKAFKFSGSGRRTTIFKTDADTLFLIKRFGDPGNTGSTGTWHLVMEDFTTVGAGSATSLGAGIYADTLLNCTFRRIDALNFKYGIYIDQSNSTLLEQCGASFNQYGIYVYNNVNGTVLTGCTTTNNDSSGIWLASGGGGARALIEGGEHGSQPRNITLGTGATAVIEQVNHERNTVANVDLFSSSATIIGGRYLLGSGGPMVLMRGSQPRLTLVGDIAVAEFNADSAYHHIADISGTGEIRNFTPRRFGYFRVYSSTFPGTHIYPSYRTIRPDNGLHTPDSTTRGHTYSVFGRNAAAASDRVQTDIRLGDNSTFTSAYLSDAWDWVLRANNSGTHSRRDRNRFIVGYRSFAAAAATFTDIKVPLSDALPDGFDNFYGVQLTAQEANGKLVTPVLKGFVATEDSANVRIWHENDTAGGFTVFVHYFQVIQRPYASY